MDRFPRDQPSVDHHQRNFLRSSCRQEAAPGRTSRLLGEARQGGHRSPSKRPDFGPRQQRNSIPPKTMKLIPLLLAISSISASAQISSYKNLVRQIQQGTGVRWDMPVAIVGAAPSALVIDDKGSLFQLWTIEQSTAKSYLLD